MSEQGRGFLSRWSQLKAAHRTGSAADPTRGGHEVDDQIESDDQVKADSTLAVAQPPEAPKTASVREAPPPPGEAPPAHELQLPAIESLTPDSDFSAFMQPGVDPQTQSAALKRLFVDSHFNRIDEMDIDIEDFSIFEPIPAQMLRTMEQARSLGFFSEEEKPKVDGYELPEVEAADALEVESQLPPVQSAALSSEVSEQSVDQECQSFDPDKRASELALSSVELNRDSAVSQADR